MANGVNRLDLLHRLFGLFSSKSWIFGCPLIGNTCIHVHGTYEFTRQIGVLPKNGHNKIMVFNSRKSRRFNYVGFSPSWARRHIMSKWQSFAIISHLCLALTWLNGNVITSLLSRLIKVYFSTIYSLQILSEQLSFLFLFLVSRTRSAMWTEISITRLWLNSFHCINHACKQGLSYPAA